MVKKNRIATLFTCLTLCLSSGFSLLSANATAQEDGEVIVISELNRSQVRREIKLVEQDLYSVFNESIDDEDMHIECYEIIPTGSHLKEQICEPRFMTEARAQNANDSQFGITTQLAQNSLVEQHKAELDALQKKMEEMTKENPTVAQIANILGQLRARLKQLDEA